jgi:hypothetical protein
VSKIKLECSNDQFHDLHDALEHTRQSSRTVKVSKEALAAMLRDQAKLIGLHRGELEGAL